MNQYKLNRTKYSTHNIIINQIDKNKNVLDVGCNTGYIGMNCDKSNKFTGIEYDKDLVSEVNKIYSGGCFSYDLNKGYAKSFPIKKGSTYDIVIFADVLEHVLNPGEILSGIANHHLKRNGKILISLPNIANWTVRLRLFFGVFNYQDEGILDKTHLHFYTYKSARKLAYSSRLLVEKELFGASKLGFIIRIFPFLKSLLATNIILICEKNK